LGLGGGGESATVTCWRAGAPVDFLRLLSSASFSVPLGVSLGFRSTLEDLAYRQFRKNTLQAMLSGGGWATLLPRFEARKTACRLVGILLRNRFLLSPVPVMIGTAVTLLLARD